MKSKIFYLLLIFLFVSGCKQDVDEFIPNGDGILFDELVPEIAGDVNDLFEVLQSAGESFLVDPTNYTWEYTSQGDLIQIPANAILDADGNVVTDEVELIVIIIRHQADMIRYRAPTITASGEYLESGGEVLVRAFKDGVELSFDESQTYSVTVADNNPDPDMKLFTGERDANGSMTWELVNDNNVQTNVWDPTMDDIDQEFTIGYEILCNRFQWYNIDKFLALFELEEPSDNKLSVTLPEGFGNTNTAVYAILANENALFPMQSDSDAQAFCLPGIPVGVELSVFVLSSTGEDPDLTYYAELQTIVVEQDQILTFTELTERTLADIELLLDGL